MKLLMRRTGPALAIAILFSMCTGPAVPGNGQAPAHDGETTGASEDHSHGSNGAMRDTIDHTSDRITVTGAVEHPLTLTVDSLERMTVATIKDFNVVCQSGDTVKENYSCKGVLLRDILEKAKIKQSGHKDRNFYIVARATDNYKATFSWGEIFNNPTGDNVYVLIEENGQPIVEKGDMILICGNDIKTGPRHVYWLKGIEVYRVE